MRRSRSRSPHHQERPPKRSRHSSRSPKSHEKKPQAVVLPMNADRLSRNDLDTIKPMFALYLDIQKQLFIEDLPEDEVKGRWKSFMGKWNRGELAEGWYDPKTLEKAQEAAREDHPRSHPSKSKKPGLSRNDDELDDEDDEDEFGPALPYQLASLESNTGAIRARPGPAIPRLQDLQIQRELAEEDAAASRQSHISSISHGRRLERKTQDERLDELVPKAAPGTRERQLEKRREVAYSNHAFAAAKDSGDVDLKETDVMGDVDSLGELKRMQQANDRKKNERELRREETLRTRRAETDERMKEMKQKEEKTMSMLKEIARVRFGGGGVDD